jgi:hypothetical protein
MKSAAIIMTANVWCMIGGRTTGEQKLNGKKKTKATLARVMGYVEQSDIHTPALTVMESLTFSAHLRLPRNVNKRSEAKFVDNVRPSLLSCIAIASKARWMAVIHCMLDGFPVIHYMLDCSDVMVVDP